jgi:preprotein translocase subunit SecF
MIDIIGKRRWYYFFSLLVIIPGVISLLTNGLRLGIDFTGGSRMTFVINQKASDKTKESLARIIKDKNISISSIQQSEKAIIVRTPPINEKQNSLILSEIRKAKLPLVQESFETIGPTIGRETTLNALKSIVLATLLIVFYIALSFRKVPKPTSSLRFGICTVVALIHDVIVVLGIFSLLGVFLHVEVDSLFVTAILTVIGFSVHDTIVVFDRIRENMLKNSTLAFDRIVNDAILQTLTRSLNTSLTALLVLFTLLLFGGETIRWFVLALFIGIASGTYSSIFNAAPLLVSWYKWDQRRKNQ